MRHETRAPTPDGTRLSRRAAIGGLLLVGGVCFGQAEEAPEAEPAWPDREQLTGDWWGARTWLADRGMTFDPYAVVDFSKNTRGGADTEGSAFRYVLSLNVTADLDTLAGLAGGSAFVDFHQHDGQLGSDEVGDWQWVGSWDARPVTQVSEVWYQQELLEGAFRLKLGKIDVNNEFAYTDLGWQFVHGSASYPATNVTMPTYPDAAFGGCVWVYPYEVWSVGFGVFDGAGHEGFHTGGRGPATLFGAPSDLYLIAEIGRSWAIGDSALPGRVAVGGWHHTGSFDRWDGGVEGGTSGLYLVGEQMLWVEAPPDADAPIEEIQGIGVYGQYDWADPDVFDLTRHIGFGATWRGAIAERDDDVVGLGASIVEFTGDPGAGFVEDAESAVELFYRVQCTPASTLQPYVQFIKHPGGAGLRDAVNVGVRLGVSF